MLLDLHRSRRHFQQQFRIDLNTRDIETPGLLWPGSTFNTVLLGCLFVREMVPSKIGECLGEEDRC